MKGARATFAAVAVAVGLTLAGAALTAPAASAQVRPTAAAQTRPAAATVTMTPAQAQLLAATEQETGVQPQMICGPPGTGCGSWHYLAWGYSWHYMGPGSPYWKWLHNSEGKNPVTGAIVCALSVTGYAFFLPVGDEAAWGGVLWACGGSAALYGLF